MARKNMDILVGNILGGAILPDIIFGSIATLIGAIGTYMLRQQRPVFGTSPKEDQWQHFSFICSTELVVKVQAIAHKEGFTIRSFMEYVMKQGVDAYESKYGKVKKIRTKDIKDVM